MPLKENFNSYDNVKADLVISGEYVLHYHSVIVGQGKLLIFLLAGGFLGIEGLNIADSLADDKI